MRVISLYLRVFVIALAQIGTSVARADSCYDILLGLNVRVVKGKAHSPGVRYLGAGHMGGRVYLHNSEGTGLSRVEKQFYNHDYYFNDKIAFQILHEIFRRFPAPYFSVVKILASDDQKASMSMEWAKGEDLDLVRHRFETVDDEIALQSLDQNFEELLRIIYHGVHFLQSSNWRNIKIVDEYWNADVLILEVEIAGERDSTANKVSLAILQKNVVVQDEPRGLVIIDPR